MARLLGFQKTKAESGADSVRLLEKVYLNRTKYGEFNTTGEIDGFINTLNRLPQTNAVQEKVADMQNKKLQVATKLNDILSDKSVFDTQLQEALNGAAKNNFKNLKSLIGSYAAIYGDASTRYDDDVVSKVSERYGSTSSIPEETLAYRKQLQEKAKLYANLFNSYNVQDPNTGEIGMLNPDNFAVVVDTSPVNGSIQRLDIIPSGEVGKGYMRTDTGVNVMQDIPNKKLPVFLRTNDMGVTSDGKAIQGAQLGNVTYQGVSEATSDTDFSKGILKANKANVGWVDKLNIFTTTRDEKLNQSIDQIRERGINFNSGAYNFDSNNIPNDAIVKIGSRVFYSTGKNDEVLEISGKNSQEKQANLDNYLKNVGKDSSKMLPYFATKDYLYSGDGNYKVTGNVDEKFFNAPEVPGQGTSFNNVNKDNQIETPEPPSNEQGFFEQRINQPNKPEQPKESAMGKTSVGDIIEKGKSFFRGGSASFFNK